MPIYAYRCSTCGQAKDVLQKMSDPVLTECPFCGAPTFVKQVTAAGFQLKGSGWYVTDFRGDSKSPKAADGVVSPPGSTEGGSEGGKESKGGDAPASTPAAGGKTDSASSSSSTSAPSPSPAPASPPPAPSAGSGTASGGK